ncbi:hypothetical protein VB834_23415 [Limnoraphis robusta Tam1]|nr:hypothetical protein [Limnoraphis robusta Tam1]
MFLTRNRHKPAPLAVIPVVWKKRLMGWAGLLMLLLRTHRFSRPPPLQINDEGGFIDVVAENT